LTGSGGQGYDQAIFINFRRKKLAFLLKTNATILFMPKFDLSQNCKLSQSFWHFFQNRNICPWCGFYLFVSSRIWIYSLQQLNLQLNNLKHLKSTLIFNSIFAMLLF
jgi:hypothetical protein